MNHDDVDVRWPREGELQVDLLAVDLESAVAIVSFAVGLQIRQER